MQPTGRRGASFRSDGASVSTLGNMDLCGRAREPAADAQSVRSMRETHSRRHLRGARAMSVDNLLYDRLAASWWDERGFLHALAALNPARFGYMRRVVTEELHLTPTGLRVLDV